VHVHRERHHIVTMCRNLNVSKAGYYAWRGREQTERLRRDGELVAKIQRVHSESRGRYGRPRILAELQAEGVAVSGKRIARLMRAHGIKGKKRRFSKASSSSPGTIPVAPNVLARKFNVPQPNSAWVSDITQLPTGEGWLYLAVVIDCFSRRVVGWSMDKYIDTNLALAALQMALRGRRYQKLILHSDRGSQFACRTYAQFLEARGITASMSRKGNCWDNAIAESFFASMKVELKPERTWKTRAEARIAVFEYIETWYNPRRRHSAIGYLSPIAFEKSPCVS
jgi:putative transposase